MKANYKVNQKFIIEDSTLEIVVACVDYKGEECFCAFIDNTFYEYFNLNQLENYIAYYKYEVIN